MSYITYIDSQGRNIIGVKNEQGSSKEATAIDNPVMIAVQPQNGQLQVQLIPLFFAEFIKPNDKGDRDFTYTYNNSTIAIGSNFNVDDKIVEQYERIITTTFRKQVEQPAKVVKLFDDV
jgi:hypothetical protein